MINFHVTFEEWIETEEGRKVLKNALNGKLDGSNKRIKEALKLAFNAGINSMSRMM